MWQPGMGLGWWSAVVVVVELEKFPGIATLKVQWSKVLLAELGGLTFKMRTTNRRVIAVD